MRIRYGKEQDGMELTSTIIPPILQPRQPITEHITDVTTILLAEVGAVGEDTFDDTKRSARCFVFG